MERRRAIVIASWKVFGREDIEMAIWNEVYDSRVRVWKGLVPQQWLRVR